MWWKVCSRLQAQTRRKKGRQTGNETGRMKTIRMLNVLPALHGFIPRLTQEILCIAKLMTANCSAERPTRHMRRTCSMAHIFNTCNALVALDMHIFNHQVYKLRAQWSIRVDQLRKTPHRQAANHPHPAHRNHTHKALPTNPPTHHPPLTHDVIDRVCAGDKWMPCIVLSCHYLPVSLAAFLEKRLPFLKLPLQNRTLSPCYPSLPL